MPLSTTHLSSLLFSDFQVFTENFYLENVGYFTTTTTTTKPYLKTLYIRQPQSALQLNNYKNKLKTTKRHIKNIQAKID